MTHAAPFADAPALPDALLLECLLTTLNRDGSVHLAPMGPIVDPGFTRALLRPYAPSTTLANLRRDGVGVLHTTDDALLFAQAALVAIAACPPTRPTADGRCAVLLDACAWRQIEVDAFDASTQPARVLCRVVETARQREFIGFNRAKHAVIEAAILATRTDHLPHDHILREMERLAPLVSKTGGRAEHEAFELLRRRIWQRVAGAQQ